MSIRESNFKKHNRWRGGGKTGTERGRLDSRRSAVLCKSDWKCNEVNDNNVTRRYHDALRNTA